MRHVVVSDNLAETEIRPPAQLERYYALSEKACRSFFSDQQLRAVDCPFCASNDAVSVLNRWSFQYLECGRCGSLYVSPRPTTEALDAFRAESEAEALWREVLEETSAQRTERILLPRLEWVANLAAERFQTPVPYFESGPTSVAYLEEVAAISPFSKLRVSDPHETIRKTCATRGWLLHADETNSGHFGVAVGFDIINRVFSPVDLLTRVCEQLTRNGLLFLTGRSLGFELLILWDQAPHLHPLDHLNVPSLEGLEQLLEAFRLEPIEMSTPGQLDVEMVIGASRRHDSLTVPRWLSYFIDRRSGREHEALQEFLQRSRLSSHFRIAAAKPSRDDR